MFNTLFFKKDTANPPWDYDFLMNLEESEYPRYLSKLFKIRTGEELPLKRYIIDKNKCKTFNQKIQYIKLYGITPLMRDCTDKVKVRDYVREKIGAEYLKPVLQLVRSEESGVRSNNLNFSLSTLNTPLFDKIDFEKLPDSFVIKCNNGCKRQFIIKNKQEYLKNKKLIEITRRNITGWIEQDYSLWNGFELNYRGIEPKILIEPLLRNYVNEESQKINAYCFNGIPEILIRLHGNFDEGITIYNKNFEQIPDLFDFSEKKIYAEADNLINQAFDLSKKLAENFNFVRVDWMIYQNKLYFEELTFTPYSGFRRFNNKKNNLKLGEMISLERGKF